MLSEQLNTEEFNTAEYIFAGMCDARLAELRFHSAAGLYLEQSQVPPTEMRSTAEIIATTLDLICQSFHCATLAHAPGIHPTDLERNVGRLREYLTLHAAPLHALLNEKSLSQLTSIKEDAEGILAEAKDESEHRQLPVAELMEVAMSSTGGLVGQALDALAFLFGREVFITPHANP